MSPNVICQRFLVLQLFAADRAVQLWQLVDGHVSVEIAGSAPVTAYLALVLWVR